MDCGVCTQKFDSKKFIPKILPACGHTLCETCIENIINNYGRLSCPFCKKNYKKTASISELLRHFPTNFQLLSVKNDDEKLKYDCPHSIKKYICTAIECKTSRVCCAFCVGRLHPDCLEANLIEKKSQGPERHKKIKKIEKSRQSLSDESQLLSHIDSCSEDEITKACENSEKIQPCAFNQAEPSIDIPNPNAFAALMSLCNEEGSEFNAQKCPEFRIPYPTGNKIPRTQSAPTPSTQEIIQTAEKSKTDLDINYGQSGFNKQTCLIQLATQTAKERIRDFESLASFAISTDSEFNHDSLLLNLVNKMMGDMNMEDFRPELVFRFPQLTEKVCLVVGLLSGSGYLVVYDESHPFMRTTNDWVFTCEKKFETQPF